MEVFILLIQLAIVAVVIVAMWKVFVKAGQPGWASIVPVYNLYIMVTIAGREWWWFLLMLVPFVNIVIGAIVSIDIARKFGKQTGFGIGLFLLPFIFYPILAFSQDQYTA